LLWFGPEACNYLSKTDPENNTGKAVPATISAELNKEATRWGFRLTTRSRRKTNYGFKSLARCTRDRCADVSRGLTTTNCRKTHLSQEEEETCGWVFPIHYCNTNKLFFVRKHCNTNFVHHGHVPIDPEHMRHGKKDIPPDVREIAEQMLGKGCPNSIINLLVSVCAGKKITPDAIKQMRRAVLISKFGNNNSDESTAETLIRNLDEDESIHYHYLTGSYDQALGQVRVRKCECLLLRICANFVLNLSEPQLLLQLHRCAISQLLCFHSPHCSLFLFHCSSCQEAAQQQEAAPPRHIPTT